MITMPYSPLEHMHRAMCDYNSAVKRKDTMTERMAKFTVAFKPVVERIIKENQPLSSDTLLRQSEETAENSHSQNSSNNCLSKTDGDMGDKRN